MNRFPNFAEEFAELAAASPFVVFLCGPSLSAKPSAGAKLRSAIKEALEAENFTVVLGEDESITDNRITSIGINLQDGELEFVIANCNAVVIVADSVGSYCELGLFSWHLSHENGRIRDKDVVLLINKKYKGKASYLNNGPAQAVNAAGRLDYVNFRSYDPREVVEKLKATRGVRTVNRRGRPRKTRT